MSKIAGAWQVPGSEILVLPTLGLTDNEGGGVDAKMRRAQVCASKTLQPDQYNGTEWAFPPGREKTTNDDKGVAHKERTRKEFLPALATN